MKYLTRDKHVATAGTIDNLFQKREEDVYKLNQVIEDWSSGDFAALNIKAPMGEYFAFAHTPGSETSNDQNPNRQ